MKIMFIVYHDLMTEARSQEMLECSTKLADETVLVSYSSPPYLYNSKLILTGKGRRRYFTFLRDSIRAIKTEKPNIVVLHDNYTAAILRWLHKHRKNTFVIYDSSELYIDRKKPKSLKLFIARHMAYFEKRYLRYANIVIAANIERATIMKKYFQLKELPIVFDNIHRIDDNYDRAECDIKYASLFSNAFIVLYGGGIAKARKTFELAKAVGILGKGYQLIVTGQGSEEDKSNFKKMIERNGYDNIIYLGFLPRNEWRYFLSKANISVSIFAQDTVNNINCASGKLYEGLFEGTPVLTSENPSLKRICSEYKVGVSNDNFIDGILELERNYEYYCQNVQEYIASIDVKERIEVLATQLKKKIKSKTDLDNFN